MALRDQPYLPLYVKDILTDEKLNLCSAESHGVYFKLMCLMHKSEKYGTIKLKHKFKKSDNPLENFANQVCKSLPFDKITISDAINELVEEDVLQLNGDILSQKRMLKDGEISEKRSKAGHNGGVSKTGSKNEAKQEAKTKQNPEYANEYKAYYNILLNTKQLKDNKLIHACVGEIFNHWNSTGFYKHRNWPKSGNSTLQSIVKNLLADFTVNEIIQAIDNYIMVVKSPDYFFEYRWTLSDFLVRGFEKFRESKNLITFKQKKFRETNCETVSSDVEYFNFSQICEWDRAKLILVPDDVITPDTTRWKTKEALRQHWQLKDDGREKLKKAGVLV